MNELILSVLLSGVTVFFMVAWIKELEIVIHWAIIGSIVAVALVRWFITGGRYKAVLKHKIPYGDETEHIIRIGH
jgi:hypothetical protein